MAENFSKLQNDLRAKRDQIRDLNAKHEEKLQPLKEAEELAELKLIDAMKAAGLEQVKNDSYTASLKTQVRAKIEDFDKFENFVLRNKRCDLFERRISQLAFQELIDSRKGKPVPGVGTFEKDVILLRATGDK